MIDRESKDVRRAITRVRRGQFQSDFGHDDLHYQRNVTGYVVVTYWAPKGHRGTAFEARAIATKRRRS